jgi:hypothetical protein
LTKNKDTPTFEQLVDWLEGRLPTEEAQKIAGQVAAGSAAVQADVSWLQKFYLARQEMVATNLPSAEPPPDISERLMERFADYAETRRRPSIFQRLIAGLTFDSHLTAASGVRTAAMREDQRQFVYETDPATIALTVQQRVQDEKLDILGQLLPTGMDEVDLVRISLYQEQTEFDATITDDLGEFTLTALPAGQYTLVLTGDRYEIQIDPLNLTL